MILANVGGTVCLECGDASPLLQSADESAHSKTKTGAASGAPTGTLVGFEVENYDPAKPLVIDPILTYSTYLGGSNEDVGYGIAVDSSGNAYITGYTVSTNFPTAAGAYQTAYGDGSGDVFVSKLNSTGTALIYSTYLGGSGYDIGQGIAVDSSGNAYITGGARSTNFPTTAGAYQTAYSGSNYDAFVSKLNSTGTALIYSTYLGGSNEDVGYGIAVDSSGNAYINGGTVSTNFPTTAGAYQTTHGGGTDDAFVTKLNSTGTALIYSTYLGGSGSEGSNDIAVDSSGNAYISGGTRSTNFPTAAGAYQTTHGGSSYDAFVSKLNSTGTALVYSTYLGGSGYDTGQGIAVDSSGNAYIIGATSSSNFPTTAGAYQATYGGGTYDAFVSKLNSTGTALIYSTYLGGSSSDQSMAIAVDSSGNAYITGFISSTNFPTTAGAYQTTYGGSSYDAFVSKLNSTGTALVYSTYLGGNGTDQSYGIAVDSSGNAYIIGYSYSNFPTTAGAYQTTYGGGTWDVFVTKLSLEATTSTTTTVTSSLNPSTSGASVTFTASVSGSGGTPAGTVTFKNGSTTLGTGTLSSGQTTYSTSSLSAGTHSITAVYGGDSAFAASTSSVLTQTVTPVNTTTATSVTSSSNPSASGASVTFTATVTASGTTTPTGTVTFMDGLTTLGTGTLSNGSATYTTSTLSAGTHSITAVYGGDTSYTGSTSSILTQTVSSSINATTTSVTSSANPSAYGASVTFTATVCCNGIISPTGTVTFKSGTTTLGTGMLSGSNTQATYTTSALIAGAHPITAVYGGNTNFAGSTSPILTQTVTNTPGVSNYSGTYSGQGVTIHLTQSSTTLSGTFSAGNINGNLGGFVDSSDRAYTWAWWDSPGSGVVAGSLGVSENPFSGSQRTFSFGGGQSTDGRIGEIILSGMRQASLSGSTTRTRGSGVANYAGTYSGQGVTITLTQSSETLSGAFIAGNVSGTMGGFVDSSGRAYVWAWWDSSSIGSGVVAGNLTVTTTSTPPTTPNLPTASDTSASQATFSFGGGQSSGGRIDEIILRGMTRQ